jgi:hypothetical protein
MNKQTRKQERTNTPQTTNKKKGQKNNRKTAGKKTENKGKMEKTNKHTCVSSFPINIR